MQDGYLALLCLHSCTALHAGIQQQHLQRLPEDVQGSIHSSHPARLHNSHSLQDSPGFPTQRQTLLIMQSMELLKVCMKKCPALLLPSSSLHHMMKP